MSSSTRSPPGNTACTIAITFCQQDSTGGSISIIPVAVSVVAIYIITISVINVFVVSVSVLSVSDSAFNPVAVPSSIVPASSAANSAYFAFQSFYIHSRRFSYIIQERPLERLDLSLHNTHSI